MSTKEKVIIYFAGGTMTGVFGAGVSSVFEKKNIYSKVEAVYGASAGAMTGAYFLAQQVPLGSSIYWENLNNNFISISGFWMGVWQRFQNKFLKSVLDSRLRDAMNIEYLMEIVKNKKTLDVNQIFSQPIPFYIKLFSVSTHKIEYVNVTRQNIFEVLKAGVNTFPYVHEVSMLNGSKYIEGAIIDVIGIKYFLDKYPNTKIVVILNRPVQPKFRYRMKNFLEGKFTSWMLHDPLMAEPFISAESNLAKDFKLIKNNPLVTIITPSEYNYIPSRTTNPEILKSTWQFGVEAWNRAILEIF